MELTPAPEVAPDARRCAWADGSDDYRAYHDTEWGVPVRGDRALFERITYEAFQSGLAWVTVMRKRPAFRAAFAGFDPHRVAAFGDADVARLLADPGIIRNRAKVLATIDNARALCTLWEQEGGGALGALMAAHAPDDAALEAEGFRRPPREITDLPSACTATRTLARALKARGFRFVGPTTLYAGMQANGFVDDHLVGCFRRGLGHRFPADRTRTE